MFLTPPSPSRTKIFARRPYDASLPITASQQQHRPESSASQLAASAQHVNQLPALQQVSSSLRDMTTHHRGLEHGLPAGMILPDPLRQPQQQIQQHSRQQPIPSQQQPPQPPPPPPPPPPPSAPQTALVRGPASDAGRGATTPSRNALPSYADRDEYSHSWRPSTAPMSSSISDNMRLEEYRSRQEEFKMRQEELRLEQRRVEQDMLRESIAKGIHPSLVPLIFVGLGGAASGSAGGFEMAQQYIAQFQQVGQQVQSQLHGPGSPDLRRDYRTMATTAGQPQYGALQQLIQNVPIGTAQTGAGAAAAAAAASTAAGVYPSPAYQSPQNPARTGGTVSARFTPTMTATTKVNPQTALPRLTTNEAQVQPSTTGTSVAGQSTMQGSDRASPSPSGIYFHHWQPPVTTSQTSTKDAIKTSPQARATMSSSTNSENTISPKKRKATGSHQPAPPPTSTPYGISSPTFSAGSSSIHRHGRRRSSVTSTRTDKQGTSRAVSKEPGSHGQDSVAAMAENKSNSQPPSQPNSGEMSTSSKD